MGGIIFGPGCSRGHLNPGIKVLSCKLFGMCVKLYVVIGYFLIVRKCLPGILTLGRMDWYQVSGWYQCLSQSDQKSCLDGGTSP